MTGKTKIDKIFIVLTPFHYKAFYALYKDAMHQDSSLIIKESYLDASLWEGSKAHILDMPEEKFNVFDFKHQIFASAKKYRQQIWQQKGFCEQLINSISLSDAFVINIASERDVFTQLFLDLIYKKYPEKNISLYAFDEGVGLYDKKKITDHIKAILYPALSILLFGQKIRFYKPMGTHKKINKVYCRFPEYVHKNGFSSYEKIDIRENNITGIYNEKSRKALIFSFANQDANVPEKDKLKWIASIQNLIDVDEFVIKLHPREAVPDVNTIKKGAVWTVLDNQFPIEELNYFDYKYIINFTSSIAMDILSSGYPKDRIITIDFGHINNLPEFYNATICLKSTELKNADKIRL